MKLRFVLGFIPVPVFYVPRLWGNIGGFSPLLFCLILNKYKDDEGLLRHEVLHIEQAWKGLLIIHGLLYVFSKQYRQKVEVEAYRLQISCYPPGHSIDFAVRMLVNDYNLGITPETARKLLTE